MKRTLLALLVLVAAVPMFAQDIDLNLGVTYSPYFYRSFTQPVLWDTTYDITEPDLRIALTVDLAKYFRLGIGYTVSFDGTTHTKLDSGSSVTESDGTFRNRGTWLDFMGYGIIPFKAVGMNLYGIAGIEYMMNLSYVDQNGADLRDGASADYLENLERFWLEAGVGTKLNLDGKLNASFEALLGYKIRSRSDTDLSNLSSGNYVTGLKLDISLLISYEL